MLQSALIFGLTGSELLIITAIMVLATVIQMAIGIGLSLCMIPLLALVSTDLVPGPAALAAYVVMIAMVAGKTRLIVPGEIGWGAGGLLIGTILGVIALSFVHPESLPRVFGILILVAVALSLSGLSLRVIPQHIAGASILSGIMGGMSGIHGPLIGLVYARESPEKVRATLGLYWIVAYTLLIVIHMAAGRLALPDLARAVVLLPGIGLGVLIAPAIARRVDGRRMRIGLYAIAIASAVALLVR
jgi:uncharacterized membrane protein YfcA